MLWKTIRMELFGIHWKAGAGMGGWIPTGNEDRYVAHCPNKRDCHSYSVVQSTPTARNVALADPLARQSVLFPLRRTGWLAGQCLDKLGALTLDSLNLTTQAGIVKGGCAPSRNRWRSPRDTSGFSGPARQRKHQVQPAQPHGRRRAGRRSGRGKSDRGGE